MNFDPRDVKAFEWWHWRTGERRWGTADWDSAKRRHLRWYCVNCGVLYSKKGRGPGMCPACLSRAVIRLSEVWGNLDEA